MPIDKLHAVETVNYDLYTFTIKNPPQASTGGSAKYAHNLYTEVIVAFPTGASNTGQADFSAIMAEVLYGAAAIT